MFTLEQSPPAEQIDPVSQEPVSVGLRRAVAHIRRALRQRAEAVSADGPALTGSEVELLRQIRRDPGLRVQDAAIALAVAPNSVSTLIRKLTAAGMIQRSSDLSDRRVARLHLTDRATAFLAQMRDVREAAITDALAKLDVQDRAAIADALPALARLVEALNAPITSQQPHAGATQET